MRGAGVAEPPAESGSLKARAQGSSFYAGMRLMPKPEREAMFSIYAFSRAVDDIADDGAGARDARSAALESWRTDIEALYAAPGGASGVPHAAVKRQRVVQRRFHADRHGGRPRTCGPISRRLTSIATAGERGRPPFHRSSRWMRTRFALALSSRELAAHEYPARYRRRRCCRATYRTKASPKLEYESRPMAVVADPASITPAAVSLRRTHEHYRAAEDVMRRAPVGFCARCA
jgi:phytoene synthase